MCEQGSNIRVRYMLQMESGCASRQPSKTRGRITFNTSTSLTNLTLVRSSSSFVEPGVLRGVILMATSLSFMFLLFPRLERLDSFPSWFSSPAVKNPNSSATAPIGEPILPSLSSKKTLPKQKAGLVPFTRSLNFLKLESRDRVEA